MTMEDKVQKLLQPRYEVATMFPAISNYGIEVGDILTDKGKQGVANQKGDPVFPFDWVLFPAIFKPLQWWERREESEMPEYVRFEINDEDYKIGKVIRWCIKKQLNYVSIENTTWDLERCTPATESDYLTFINKPK